MAKHTKTPWKVDHQASSLLTVIRDEDGYRLAVIEDADGHGLVNAFFIVIAVNNHDKLFEALQGCETLLTMIESDHPYSVPKILSQARQALKEVGK